MEEFDNYKEYIENYRNTYKDKLKHLKQELKNKKSLTSEQKDHYMKELRQISLENEHFFKNEIESYKIESFELKEKYKLTKDKDVKKHLKSQIRLNQKYIDLLEPNLLLKISLVFMKLSFISFGGGNAVLPIFLYEIVNKRGWISNEYFDKIMILSNALPGPSIIQVSAIIGYELKGWWGAFCASFIANLPLLFISSILAALLQSYVPKEILGYISLAILPVIMALIVTMIIRMIRSSVKELSVYQFVPIIIIWLLFLIFVPKPYNIPAIAIILMIILSLIIYEVKQRRVRGHNNGN